MTRSLAVMQGIAFVAGASGLTALFRPSWVRRLFGWAPGEQVTYALRIVGMMLTALGLFLGGFAVTFRIALAG